MSFVSFKSKGLATILGCVLIITSLLAAPVQASNIDAFVGSFSGTADFVENDKTVRRDMSATIKETYDGFSVSWTSGTYKPDGRIKEKTYTIEFVPSEREDIYASAMQKNVFGKQVPLNPLKGEPFVWGRIVGDTLSVFSLFINEAGDYEMQEYHRTLAEGGLDLEFRRFRNGLNVRSIGTFLSRD